MSSVIYYIRGLLTKYRFSLLNKRGGESTVAGGTAMSFSLADPSVFVVGTESGRVYKCAISSVSYYSIYFLLSSVPSFLISAHIKHEQPVFNSGKSDHFLV